MLIPQFSLRWLLAVMTASAVVFTVFGLAMNGQLWAVGVSVGIVALVVLLLVHFLLFMLVGVAGALAATKRRPPSPGPSEGAGTATSPFRPPLPQSPDTGLAGNGPNRLTTTCLLAFLTAAVCCENAAGQSGTVHNLAGRGLRMSVDTRWLDGPGYRPVRIVVTPTVPPIADRTLTVEYLSHQYHWRQIESLVRQDIDIPAGTTGAIAATLSVPQTPLGGSYSISVWEDGQIQKSLSISRAGLDSPAWQWQDCFPLVLFIGDTLPDTSELGRLLGAEQFHQHNRHMSVLPSTSDGGRATALPGVMALKLHELPLRWIDYTTADIIALELGQLEKLAANSPDVFHAILRWTAAGGNLWVWDLGADWKRLEQLGRLLGAPAEAGNPSASPAWVWQSPDPKDFSKQVPTLGDTVFVNGRAEVSVDSDAPKPATKPPAVATFRLRPYGAGLVVALADGRPFPGQPENWRWLLNSMGSERWLWCQRHGVSMVRENRGFWNFLIPGVGLAPVTEFCVLISLFVLAIGPLNYWLLWRRRKLHLLVVTIPAAALAVTLLLFGYAVIVDGLGTRVRARSVTLLDQQRGEAVCWSRLSYYAGLAPRGGLRFPEDVAVLPIQFVPVDRSGLAGREILWGTDQHLISGWLPARTPTQYLTLRSRRTDCRLELLAGSGNTAAPQVENRLDAGIEQLVARTRDGRFYAGEAITRGGVASLRPLEPAEAARRLRDMARANQPELPAGLNPAALNSLTRSGYYNRYWYGPLSGNQAAPSPRTSRLEQLLAGLAEAGPQAALGPGEYAAVLETAPEVVLGTAAAREEASCHVILGKW